MELTLIGSSHFDLSAYERLTTLLSYLKPETIGIEGSQASFREDLLLRAKLWIPEDIERIVEAAPRKLPEVNTDTLRLFLESRCGENKAICEFVYKNNVPVTYCESEEILRSYDSGECERFCRGEEIPREFMDFIVLSPEEARKNIEEEYSLRTYPVKDDLELAGFYTIRDEFAQRCIRNAIERRNLGGEGNRVVYVCGLDHIFGDYQPNLFDRLQDLGVKRMKLCEADNIK